ncbi:hypothetical protein [Sphingobacterium sp. LRF_L2]|uniref:hypothetical protein n=1 Tax=Sphingobacterium sp. LRF_L2 TaxID=3369421 RepID=UPI003F5DCB4A
MELVKPRWEDFVPVEWKTILQKQGNLKKDGAADLAVIFEGNLALLLFPDLSVVDRLRTSCCVCFVYGVASLKGVLPM